MDSDFHTRRLTGVGGSDVAALLGLSPFKTPLQLYMEKKGLAKTEETRAMRLGNEWEPIIAREYALEAGVEIVKGGFHRHPDYPFLFAHLDYQHTDGTPVECKRVGISMQKAWGEPGTNQIPDYYNVQVQVQMACVGAQEAIIAAMFSSRDDLRIYRVGYSQEIFAAIVRASEDFWKNHVEAGMPPPETDPTIMRDYIAAIYPSSEPKKMLCDESLDALILELGRKTNDLRAAEDQLEDVANQIKLRMAEHEMVEGKYGKIYWKSGKPRTQTNWKGVASACNPPGYLIDKHTTTQDASRTFRPYLKGEEASE